MNKEYYIRLQAKIDNSANTITKLNSQIKSLEGQVRSLEIKIKTPTTATKGFGDLNTQLNKLRINMSDFQNNMLSATTTFDSVTTRYTNNAGKILTVQEKMIDGETRYRLSLKEVGSAVENNAKQADKWKYSWTKAFQSFTTYMSVTTVFYQVIHTIRDMITEVTELDSALVELQKVTTLEGESLQKFTEEAYRAADAVAKTGTEMINAATEFAKAGYDESQALKLGELALMYTNIADEQVSAAEASEFMIAQMKTFNIEAEDAIHIIDAVNEVANNFAVSSADIANNLGNSSAVMANAGNSYEQMIGLLTAGTEITRSASKVSNGLKTITLRLQGMNDEGEKDLELTAQMEELYNKLGVSVYDANGELKNTYELLKTLSEIYPNLTAAEKAYVTETIAGKYQAQNAAAILSNFQTALEATETAYNSTGSAMAENEKVIGSIQGRISALSSQFEKLSQNIIGSGLVKAIVDLGVAFLTLANSGVGRAVITMTGLITAGLALAKGFEFVKTKVKSLTLGIIDYYKYQVLLYAQSKQQTIANYAEAASYLGLANSIKAVTLAMLTNPIFIAGAAITALATFNSLAEKSEQAMLDMAQASQDASNSLDELDDNLTSITEEDINNLKKYKEILSDSSSTTTELSTANEGLAEIQNRLNMLFGNNAIDVYKHSVDETIAKVQELTAEELKLYKVKNESALQDARNAKNKDINSDAIDIFHGDSDVSKRGFGDILGDLSQKDDYGSLYFGDGSTFTRISGEAEDAMRFINDALNYVKDNRELIKQEYGYTDEDLDELQRELSDAYNNIESKYQSHLDFLKNYYDTLLKYVNGGSGYQTEMNDAAADGILSDDEINTILNKYPEVKKVLEDVGYDYNDLRSIFIDGSKDIDDAANTFANAYDKMSYARQQALQANTADNLFDDINDANKTYIKELYDGLVKLADSGELTEDSIRNLINSFDGWSEQGENFVYDLDGTSVSLQDLITYFSVLQTNIELTEDKFEGLNDILDSIQSAFDLAVSAVEEYNNQGYLSVDTLQELANLSGEYLELLFDEANQLAVNKTGFDNLAIAQLNLLKTKQQENLLSYVDSLKGEGNQLTTNTELVNNLTAALEKNNAELATNIALSSVSGDFTEEEVAAIQARVQAVIAYYKEVENTKNKILNGSGYITSSGSSSSSSSSSSSKEWWETELEKLRDQFNYNEITIQEYINGLSNLLGKVSEGTDAWREINDELQKQKLDKVEDDYKRGTITLDEYIKKLKELIKAYKKGTDAWNDLADSIKEALQDKADQQKDDLETAEEAALEIIDREIEKLNELKKEKEDYYDQLIKDKEEANEESEKELELARLQEALENARKEKTKRVKCMLSIKMAQNGETPEEDNTVGKICFEI